MGYSTRFEGELKFVHSLIFDEWRELNQLLGADIRDFPGLNDNAPFRLGFTFIDLEYTDNLDGLRWDGSEKTWGMIDQINFISHQMRKINPKFQLEGEMRACGEEFGDMWLLKIDNNGRAYREDL